MSSLVMAVFTAKNEADKNTAAVERLTEDNNRFHDAIRRTTKDSNPSDAMNEGLQNLTRLFEEMNKFCDEHDQRSFLQRIFKRSAHAAKIAEYQHAITHALATFGVEANLRMIASQEQILKKLDNMSKLENGEILNPRTPQSGVFSRDEEKRT
ncbi:hypothetical protein B0H13DRAFT_2340361 [Mycena leptocephala]|nr:hypothetical protein B0H13DRAFT_2340361 [Mycena leptocephala]